LTSQTRSLLALGALVALGVGGFRLWTLANAPSRMPETPPDDDLEMLATITDGGPAGTPDRLAAGSGHLVVARGADGTIEVQPVAGGTPTALAHLGLPVAGLAVTTDAVWVSAGRTVRRVPLDGGAPVVVTDKLVRPRAIAADESSVVVVDVDPTLSGSLHTSRVVRLPATGPREAGASEPTVLGEYQGEVVSVAIDRGTAFWADRLEGAVLSAAAGATTLTTLTTDRGLPGSVIVVGDQVVWVEQRSESLWTVPRTGGTPRQIVQDFAGFAHLTAHGRRVAWVNEAAVDGTFRVLEVPVDGGEVVTVSPDVDAIDGLASDGERLFWLRDGVARPVDAAD
jgi:hypothetical protein